MCGIAGLLDARSGLSEEAMGATARSMVDSLRHRGPDAGGIWVDPRAGVALGNRRLSIIDLSAAGAQPMVSSCGRFAGRGHGEHMLWDILMFQVWPDRRMRPSTSQGG